MAAARLARRFSASRAKRCGRNVNAMGFRRLAASRATKMSRERPGALFARRTRTFRKCSFDARSQGQPWPLPPILEKRGRGKRKGSSDSLCSRNARSRTPLVGRAHGGKPPGRPSRLGRARKVVDAYTGMDRSSLINENVPVSSF